MDDTLLLCKEYAKRRGNAIEMSNMQGYINIDIFQRVRIRGID